MDAVVIENVPVDELPAAWQAKLLPAAGGTVTVRIEAEPPAVNAPVSDVASEEHSPLFGMWRDREDMADVAAYVRRIRAGRFPEWTPDGD